jgi:hypothetical protein
VHFVDDPWTDLDEIRGHLLSIDQLRPRLRRLRELYRRGQSNVNAIGGEAYDGCMMGQLTLERSGRGGALKRIKEATVEMRTSRIKTLLGDIEDTSLVDDESEDPGSARPPNAARPARPRATDPRPEPRHERLPRHLRSQRRRLESHRQGPEPAGGQVHGPP